MAVIPTLGEINAYQPNPDLGGGSPAVVIDNRETVRLLNEAANQKAQNDWNKYLVFQNNLKDVYKNLGDISSIETATTDKDYLSKQAAEVYKEIGENPKDFFSGGGKYNEIQAKIAKLRSEATESKLNQVYDFAHKQYLTQNPELNTPENQTKINEYLNTPLGQRKGYILDMPSLFNAQDYFGALLNNPLVKSAFAESGLEDNDKFIRDVVGTKYKRDAFLNLAKMGFDTQVDKYGHSIQKAITERYNQLPEFYKADYEKRGGVKTFFNEMAEHYFGSDKDITEITKNDLSPNSNAYKDEELALQRRKQGFDEWAEKQRIAIGWKNADKEDKENVDAALSILRLDADILNNSLKPENLVKVYNPETKQTNSVYKLSDPSLLRQFANMDAAGKTTDNFDEIWVDKDNKKIRLIRFKRDPETGQIKQGERGGNRAVDETASKFITSKDWIRQTTKSTYTAGNAGDVYGHAETILNKSGGDIFDLANQLNGNETKQAGIATPSSYTNKAKMADGTLIYTNDNGNTWYDEKGNAIK